MAPAQGGHGLGGKAGGVELAARGDSRTCRYSGAPSDHGFSLAGRRCTDPLCALLFFLSLCAMVAATMSALGTADPRRLTHGLDYRGELCGVDPSVLDSPLVYFCATEVAPDTGMPTALDLENPICVMSCPEDFFVQMPCYSPGRARMEVTGREPYTTVKRVVEDGVEEQPSYPSLEVEGLYCLPRLGSGREAVASWRGADVSESLLARGGPLASPWLAALAAAGGLRRGWPALACCAALSVLLGYAFLLGLRCSARWTARLCLLAVAVGAPLAAAALLRGGAAAGGLSQEAQAWSGTSFRPADGQATAAAANALAALGLAAAGLLCRLWRAGDRAWGCIEAACECIFAEPALLLWPAVAALAKLAIAACSLSSVLLHLSETDFHRRFLSMDRVEVPSKAVGHEASATSGLSAALLLLGLLWQWELASAVSHFTISYAVALWYYTPKPKAYEIGQRRGNPVIRGLFVGLVFHLGSLALGALLVPPSRLCGLLGDAARRLQARIPHAPDLPVIPCVAGCLARLVAWAEASDRRANKFAYIDVCMSSSDFLEASRRASETIGRQGLTVLPLYGECCLVAWAGVLWISGVAAVAGYLLIAATPDWSSDASPHFVSSPYLVGATAAVLAGVVASCFATLCDHTADTLLYMYAWNRQHSEGSVQWYAPDSLLNLLQYAPLAKSQPEMGPDVESI